MKSFCSEEIEIMHFPFFLEFWKRERKSGRA